MGKMTTAEVTEEQFDDLIHDRIAPWRLKEVGFVSHGAALRTYHTLQVSDTFNVGCGMDGVWLNGKHLSKVTTFTDLLTLIKFLTPPTK